MYLGADPVHGERDEPHADFRVEARHGLHEADVAFLDEVANRQAVTGVAARDVDDEPQVRQHELAGRVEVVVVAQPLGQRDFVLAAQHRDTADRVDIGIKTAERAREHELGRDYAERGQQRSLCVESPRCWSGILAIKPLEC